MFERMIGSFKGLVGQLPLTWRFADRPSQKLRGRAVNPRFFGPVTFSMLGIITLPSLQMPRQTSSSRDSLDCVWMSDVKFNVGHEKECGSSPDSIADAPSWSPAP
jgi:hypothetical protein